MESNFVQIQNPAFNKVILISNFSKEDHFCVRKTAAWKTAATGMTITSQRPLNNPCESTLSRRASHLRLPRAARSSSSHSEVRLTSMGTKAPPNLLTRLFHQHLLQEQIPPLKSP